MLISAFVFGVLLFFIRYLKRLKGEWMRPSVFLAFIYFLSLLCCCIHIKIANETAISDFSFIIPAVSFLFFFFLYFVPICCFKENTISKIVLPSKKTIDTISTVLIILSFVSILYFSTGVVNVFSYGDLGAARNDRYIYGESFIEYGLMYTISSVSASLYVFDILFFFIYLSLGGSTSRCVLLFISSFSEILHVLTEAGRDGVVFWMFSFVFLFLFFKDFISFKKRKMITKYFVIFASAMLIPFIAITIGRFGENATRSMVSYMGQSFLHYCYFFSIEPRPISYGQGFPLFFEILNKPMPPFARYANEITASSAFGTFFREFFVNFGVIGTIVLGLLLGLIFKRNVKIKDGMFDFHSFFVYILYFQVFSQGVFYFRHYTRGGNLFICICLLCGFLSRLRNNENRIVLNKCLC